MTPKNKPVVLVVLDGWGIGNEGEHNGVHLAQTPNFDRLRASHPYTELEASGAAVGLPEGQMGNSEVGHTTIGAGCVIYQDLVRITKDIANGDFHTNPALREAFEHTQKHTSQLHIIGLLSSGGVHSHEDHFHAVIDAAKQSGVETIILHPILDGRDSSPTGGGPSLAKLEAFCAKTGGCAIASVSGRYYPMDRDKNWERTDKGFQAIWYGKADREHTFSQKPSDAIHERYAEGEFDELMEPMVFRTEQGAPYAVKPNDSIIFTNYRTDRTKQLSAKISELIEENNLCFVTMTDYGKEVTSVIAYEPQVIEATLASTISEAGFKQAHLAETDKYAHATYFLNGGRQEPHENEEHKLVQSRQDVKTHDQAPEMMAKELGDETITRLPDNDFIFLNWANADMVGHTAVQSAIITAVETVDRELGRLADAVVKEDGVLLVIADHGNAEQMVTDDGSPHTAHTTNIVPCILISQKHTHLNLKKGGGLSDIAPTILDLLGLEKPACMTGSTLLED